jgi:thiopeptide-type bacteriocin biosynthesis protein
MRNPLYSFEDYHVTDYSTILKTSQFQLSIFLASKDFYDELLKKQFNYTHLTAKQKRTVAKYFNRASFRSTPFGLFSSFSLVGWNDSSLSNIRISEKADLSIKPDFSILANLHEYLRNQGVYPGMKLRPNQSLYFTGTDCRYIKSEIAGDNEAKFSMVSVVRTTLLQKLLKFCKKEQTLETITEFIVKLCGASEDNARIFIQELYAQRILVSDAEPNITGTHYSQRLPNSYSEDKQVNALMDLLGNIGQTAGDDNAMLHQLNAATKAIINNSLVETKNPNVYYSVAERNVTQGGLPAIYQEKIMEGIHCLSALCRPYEASELTTFARAFENRYGSCEVPLLQAIDPQYGIGYGDFEEIKDGFSFKKVNGRASGKNTKTVEEASTYLMKELLNEWHQFLPAGFAQNHITITDEHLESIEPPGGLGQLPPSISVMFRILGDNIVIENAGGSSALALLGRFCYAPSIHAFARQIAQKEQDMNKDVVFAEIAHLCSLHTANINCRPHLRDYEIPVLTHSDTQEQQQIHLHDIMVSVSNNIIKLRSKRLKKNIIPRLASAYNFTKNVLPVFRFLCDMQYQQLNANYSFSLSTLLPGLNFYPRVQYKSCILQLAEWHINVADLKAVYNADTNNQPKLFRQVARKNGYPDMFAYTVFDNFIVFNITNDDDIVFFLEEIKTKTAVVIKEFPFTESTLHAEDTAGKKYISQYVASLYATKPSYSNQNNVNPPVSRKTLNKAAKEWLYFKIYCHPISANNILCNHIYPLIAKQDKTGKTKEWFWVRYNDPNHHIRLRIKPASGMTGFLFETFSSKIQQLIDTGVLQNFKTDTYLQELDRYPAALINTIEAVFKYSSYAVFCFIKNMQGKNLTDDDLLIEAVTALKEILVLFNFDSNQKITFCKIQFEAFFKEFGQPKTLKPELEMLTKKMNATIANKNGNSFHLKYHRHLKAAIETLYTGIGKKQKSTVEKLAADIIHMHFNRLFAHQQRYLEMATYFIIYRHYEIDFYKVKNNA